MGTWNLGFQTPLKGGLGRTSLAKKGFKFLEYIFLKGYSRFNKRLKRF